MKITAFALLVVALAAGPAAAQQKETETVDRTVAFSRGGTLKLTNFSGEVRVTGTPGNDVIIHAVRKATRERLDNITLDIVVNGSTVEVEANRRNPAWREKNDNVVETQFEIQVPAATRLDLHTFSGNVIVRDTTEEVNANTFSGSVDLDIARASAAPALKVETFSGDITTRMPAGSSGRVEFHSFSGDLRSDLPLLLHNQSRRNVSADFGSGGGATLDFKTFSGDLKIVQ
ncbi:MAG: DUF4097 family beta strand repeat-containing protein [Acidobacteriota bacterium]